MTRGIDHQGTRRVITQVLEAYDQQQGTKGVDEFCIDILQQRKRSQTLDVKATVEEVSRTIDQIDQYHREILGLQKAQKSKVRWLNETLNQLVDVKSVQKRNEIIQEVHQALSKANHQTAQIVLPHEQVPKPTPLPDYTFEDVNATVISDALQSELQTAGAFSAILLADRWQDDSEGDGQEIAVARRYFENDLDSPLDRDIKKVVSVGTIIAQEEGLLPQLAEMEVPQITSIVDMGVSAVKVGYKVAEGKFHPAEAVEYLYDRATAVACTLTRWKSTAVGGITGVKIGATMGSVFGRVGIVAGAVTGGVVGSVAGKKVGSAISRGVKTVARVAKQTVKKVWQKTKTAVSSVVKKLNPFNWF